MYCISDNNIAAEFFCFKLPAFMKVIMIVYGLIFAGIWDTLQFCKPAPDQNATFSRVEHRLRHVDFCL